MSLSLLLLSLLLLPLLTHQQPHSCDLSSTSSLPFCNAALPITHRVDDLLARLTLHEKISQLGDLAPAVPRLGLPAFAWWSESLHGVSNSGKGIRFDGTIKSATSFPQVLLTAASFDQQLWFRVAQAIGTEARAVYNAGQANGLTFWSPNINIFRDPRWGRGQETPGEDPLTSSRYAVAYVRGLQGEPLQGGTSLGLKASACCKHFTAYDLDKWKGNSRFSFNAIVAAQDLADTFNPPFKSCVEQGHASGIMCSYNRVNGVPSCADYNLLSKTARQSWGFNGYVTSDCDAVSIIHDNHGYAKTPEDAVADVLKAGMDLNCGKYLQNYTASALQQKKIAEADINRALRNLFSIRMRLGLFNGNPRYLKYGNIGPDQVCTQEHQNLALEVARDGIVLLKNAGNILPLSQSKVISLAVIGPNANSAWKLLGNYAGPPCKSIEPLKALQNNVKDVRYLSGCDTVACPMAQIGQAVQLAKSVDYVVMFMGLDQTQEKEDLDRENLVLPGQQQTLISSVAKATKRPVILVLICGGPVDVTFAKFDPKIGGILWAGYPGEAGALAIVDVLFGRHNPGGKLPMTWYPQEFVKIPMTDMRMRPDPKTGYPGRTYRFYTGKEVYHFGYGLSYSSYSHNFLSVGKTHLNLNKATNKFSISSYKIENLDTDACEKLKFSTLIGVQNNGKMAGKHSVLLFLKRANDMHFGSPKEELIAFERVHLKAGESTKVEFGLDPCEHFSRAEMDGSMVLDGGVHSLTVGDEEYKINLEV